MITSKLTPDDGAAIFLAQFAGDTAPFDTLEGICKWAAKLGFKGIQLPGWDERLIDIKQAAASKAYAEEIVGIVAKHGLAITEIANHVQGQLVAVHSAHAELFDAFAPEELHKKPVEQSKWAVQQIKSTITASSNMGLTVVPTFPGTLVWPYVYPWPQRPEGLVEEGFKELARRWKPILDHGSDLGISIALEVHPMEDVHDGATFEMFLEALDEHEMLGVIYDPSHFVLQYLDYLAFIDLYHDRILACHMKDAELNYNGRTGVYGGYQSWQNRAGRFRSLGDGQVDFKAIVSKFAQYDLNPWKVVEWECCLKDAEQGAKEAVPFIESLFIQNPAKAFDDFAGGEVNVAQINSILGITAT
jgi:sugar phosphate isomerase/epimerase